MKVLVVERTGPVAHVILNRPLVHNAFNEALLTQLIEAFEALEVDDDVRVVVLQGEGRSFCAGADLEWMKSMAACDEATNREGALRLGRLFRIIDACQKPVVARVQGAAIGGGCGLVAVCDIVVCGPRARFGFGEVRLGLAPAVISPFVVRKIGSSQARRYFLTGERIGPEEAARIGLAHVVVGREDGALDGAVADVTGRLLRGGPKAIAACKQLARQADLFEDADERFASIIAAVSGA